MIEIAPQFFTLSNSMRVVYLHADSPVAHLGVTILAGSRYEQNHEEGLAHFLEHCIFKGTSRRKSFHILSRLDSVGGELNAYTTKEEICIYASFVKNHLNRSAELLADIVVNSNFPEREIEKEKDIILDELNSYLDTPSERIFDDFEKLMFPNHPLGNNILGTKDTVQNFTREDLQQYVERYFFAENIVLSFVGDISPAALLRQLEKHFAMLGHGKQPSSPMSFNDYKPFYQRIPEGNFQAHCVIGGIAPGHNDEWRRGMTLLVNILGGPAMNSRLSLSVREKYGYTYNIEAGYTPYADIGYWYIYFGTDQKFLDKTIKVIERELKKLREFPLTPKQLKMAKEQLKGHIALSLEGNVGLMQGLGKSLLLFNQIDSIEDIYASIDKVTSEELLKIANEFFDPKKTSALIFEVKE